MVKQNANVPKGEMENYNKSFYECREIQSFFVRSAKSSFSLVGFV